MEDKSALHEYFEYKEDGAVLPIFERIRDLEVPDKSDFTEDLDEEVKTIEKNIEIAPTEDILDLINQLKIRIDEIQKQRQSSGYSNFMFFQFYRLKSKAKQELDQREAGMGFKKLYENEIIGYLAKDRSKNGLTEFPDTINEFINLAPAEILHMGTPEMLSAKKFPVLFYTSPEVFQKIKKEGKVHVITGHCIIGFEPSQNKDEQIKEGLKKGIALQDLIVYNNLKDILSTLEEKVEIEGLTVNLDTFYYQIKLGDHLEQCKEYKVEDCNKILEDIVEDHTKTIKKILPHASVRASASEEYLNELMEIVDNGLLDYILNEIRIYMGHDLTVEKEMAKALAVTSATYMLPVLKKNVPTIAIESALNAENPAGICYSYLKKIGKEDMFSFVGLYPLPNTRVSHACMYYGDSKKSKIYLRDSEEEVKRKIEDAAKTHENPNYCFIVNYHLSTGMPLPKDCSHKLCNLHADFVAEDIVKLLEKYK